MDEKEPVANASTNDLARLRASRRWIDIQSLRPSWGASWSGSVWVTPDFIDAAFGLCDRVYKNEKIDAAIIKVFAAAFRVMKSHHDFGRVEEGTVQLLLMANGEGDESEDLFIGIRRTEEGECYIAVEADIGKSND